MKADATHCIQHAPLTHKEICRLLEERLHIMGKKTRDLENSVSCAGRSILEMMWSELDNLTATLMDEWSGDLTDEEVVEHAGIQGQARGVALCIAFVTNPYHPNVDAVGDEALERYEAAAAEVEERLAKRKNKKAKKGKGTP